VKMLRPPSAKMKGGRKPRTMLHPKDINDDPAHARDNFTVGVRQCLPEKVSDVDLHLCVFDSMMSCTVVLHFATKAENCCSLAAWMPQVNLNPLASRTLITFNEKKSDYDPITNRKPKLHMFEHHRGSRVYEGLMPDYQLPNGKKVFFYYESRMVEEVEVLLRKPITVPITLTETLQVSRIHPRLWWLRVPVNLRMFSFV
jgi:hypothetical protein